MFHLRVFSISIYKICKSNIHLLVCVIFPDLGKRQGSSVKAYFRYLFRVVLARNALFDFFSVVILQILLICMQLRGSYIFK